MLSGGTTPKSNHQRWFKTREVVESDDPKIHASIIAYASDAGNKKKGGSIFTQGIYIYYVYLIIGILATAAYANGLRFGGDRIGMMASLDHSIWFHRPCRADDW
jgi:acyl-CoA thioesterase